MPEDPADEALARVLRRYYASGEPVLDADDLARTAMAKRPRRVLLDTRSSWLVLQSAGATIVLVAAAWILLVAIPLNTPDGSGASPRVAAPTGPTTTTPAASATPGSTPTPSLSAANTPWEELVIDEEAREAEVLDVTGTASRLVVVGALRAQPAVWVSPDGRQWARGAGLPETAGGYLADVTTLGPGFLAVGWSSTGPEEFRDSALVLMSADGQSWAMARDDGSFDGGRLAAVAAGPESVVAVGTGGDGSLLGWRSVNGGRFWQLAGRLQSPLGSSVSAVVWTGRTFVAVGELLGQDRIPGVWVSDDGATWSAVDSDFAGGAMADVVSGIGGLIAVGSDANDRAAVWRSVDGREWTLAPDPPSAQGLIAVAQDAGDVLVAAGRPGAPTIWRSRSGAAWEQEARFHAGASASVDGFARIGSRWVAAGDDDGRPIAWTTP